MQSSIPTTFSGSAQIGTHHVGTERVVRRWSHAGLNTYSLITSTFRVVWDVAYCVLTPYNWVVIIGLELLRNKLCPGFEGLQLSLAKYDFKVTLYCRGHHSPDMILNDANQCDCLIWCIRYLITYRKRINLLTG